MQMTKKVLSIVLAVMMVVSMMVVGTVVANAATAITNAEDFYNACKNGGEYELANDITLDYNRWTFMRADTVIDGKGYTISADVTTKTDTFFDWYLNQKAKLTLSNVTLDGKGVATCAVYTRAESLSGTEQNDNADCVVTFTNVEVKNFVGFSYVGAVYLFSHATGVFTDCNFHDNVTQDPSSPYEGSDIWAGGATHVTINGGTFADTVYGNASGSLGSEVTVTGGANVDQVSLGQTTQGGTAQVTIEGDSTSVGTVSNEANNNNNVTISNNAQAGVVEDFSGVVDTAKSSNGIANYDELVAAAANGGSYYITADFDISTVTVPADKKLSINFNGHKVTTTVGKGFKNNGTLTLKDSTGNGGLTGVKQLMENNGTLTIESGKYVTTGDGTGNEDSSCAFYTTPGSTLTVDGGEIDAYAFAIWPQGLNAKVVVNNGTITSETQSAISGNGTKTATVDRSGYIIEVNGGTITAESQDGAGIYHPNAGTLTVKGGTISGGVGIYIKAGTATFSEAATAIENAVVHGTGDKAPYRYNGSGLYGTGDAIVVENCGYPGGEPSVEITGGTFISDKADAVASYVLQDDPTKTADYDRVENFITGGAFSNNATPHVDGGFTTKGNDNYYHVVSYDDAMAKEDDGSHFGIDDNLYANLKLLGAQKKERLGDDYKNTSESGQEGDYNIRFVAVINSDIIAGAEDYGFVVAKAGSNKVTADYAGKFDKLVANWGNGEKTISAMGTFNNVCDNITYGDPDETSTYKYVTCAINNLDNDTDSVIARFFVKVGGKYYYSNYTTGNTDYRGCVANYAALV